MRLAVRFGPFEADMEAAELRKQGAVIPLQKEPFQLLRMLVSEAGEVITRKRLQDGLWSSSTHVDFDHSLNTAMSKLRKALGDKANAPRFIETLQGIGYRFLVPVEQFTGARSRLLLAVLPLKCLSQDPEQEYFCDGLTEELISRLGHVDPLRLGVIAKTSSRFYKDSEKSTLQIAQELGVGLVLEGSLRREDARIRVSARLIDVTDQTQVWSDSYDRSFTGMLDLQRDVARSIVVKTCQALDLEVKKSSASTVPSDSQAYQTYLKGRYHLQKLTRQSLLTSVGLFDQAIGEDADFAIAYAALGETYNLLQFCGTPSEGFAALAREAALRALELDDTLASAHNALAGVLLFYDWNWVEAERAFKRGLQLNPSMAEGYQSYAILLSATGRHVEAIRQAEEALRLDPVSLISNTNLAWRFFRARRYDNAIDQARKTLELEQEFSNALWCIGKSMIQQGDFEEGCDSLQKAVDQSPENMVFKSDLAVAYSKSSMPEEALKVLSLLKSAQSESYVSQFSLALASLATEGPKEALQCLERALDQRDPYLIWLNEEIYFDPLRTDARFQRLLKKMNLGNKKDSLHSYGEAHWSLPLL